MATNPILTEIQGRLQSMSPQAQAVIARMAPQTSSVSSTVQPASPAPGMLLPPSDVPPQGPGTISGDTATRSTLLGQKPGIENIAHDVEGSRLGQAHPFLGKLLGGAAEGAGMVGDTLLHAVSPRLESLVPGSEGNYSRNLGRANTALTQDEFNAGKEADTGEATARTGLIGEQAAAEPQAAADTHAQSGATTANLQSETRDRDATTDQGPSLAISYSQRVNQVIRAGGDPNTDPIVQYLADAITNVQKQATPPPGTKVIQREVGGKPHNFLIDERTGADIKDEGETGEKPATVNVNAGISGLDREVKQYGSPYQKASDSASSQIDKITDAENMIRGNAESQALGIPKVLTALVGGQGTGVRITTPELNAIARARGWSGDFEGTLNRLSGKGQLASVQQQQLSQILDDVKVRLQQKQKIAIQALDSMGSASTREDILAADKLARKQLSDMENSSAPSGGQNTPQSHDFSLSGWVKANPKGDPKAAEAAAKKAGYTVVK